jgi:hypothetical protein
LFKKIKDDNAMKRSFSIEIYKEKLENNLLNVEIIHLNKHTTLVVLRHNFDFNEDSEVWNFNQYYLTIPSSYIVTKEDVMNNFFDWILTAQENEAFNM